LIPMLYPAIGKEFSIAKPEGARRCLGAIPRK
jgi:hypothetical protein